MYKLSSTEVRQAADFFVGEIARLAGSKPISLMEVCGTHTVAIFKAGIKQLLPPSIQLLSGPGCPVCVTPNAYLDTAIAYSRKEDIIITTFGDMLKVPGSTSSLALEKAKGRDIRIIYSPLESLEIARNNPTKKIIFLAVGFETTAPIAAATIIAAKTQRINNFFVLSAHKLVPPILKTLLLDGNTKIDGFLLPGHVSSIIGITQYKFLADEFKIPGVVSGFEPLDILQSIYMLVKQLSEYQAYIENQYSRGVPLAGNKTAHDILYQVYEVSTTAWRGLGNVNNSGLIINNEYKAFDALVNLPIVTEPTKEAAGCKCGEVLRGTVQPIACPLFGKLCTPENPQGSCMVSIEGTCAAWYKYGSWRLKYE